MRLLQPDPTTAQAIGVSATEITDLRRLSEHNMLLFKADFLCRSQISSIMRDQLEQHGLIGLVKGRAGHARID